MSLFLPIFLTWTRLKLGSLAFSEFKKTLLAFHLLWFNTHPGTPLFLSGINFICGLIGHANLKIKLVKKNFEISD